MMEATKIQELLINSDISVELIELVIKRLKTLTYEVLDDDAIHLAFSIQKVENTIKNTCNINRIPKELFSIAVDMVCGEFLYAKNQTNALSDTFDLDYATSVSLGDVKVSFSDDATTSQKLDALISYLLNNKKGQLLCFRRLRW